MAGDRILWNRRPADVGDAGSVDEIVAYGVTFHIEQMSDSCYWFSVTWPDGKSWDGNIVGTDINLQLQEDNNAPWAEDDDHSEQVRTVTPSTRSQGVDDGDDGGYA